MDRYTVIAFVPVIGLFFTGLVAFSFTRLGRALARRIEGAPDEKTEARLVALERDNELLRNALADAHERLDFTERALIRDSSPKLKTPV